MKNIRKYWNLKTRKLLSGAFGFSIALASLNSAQAQYQITSLGSTFVENFDTFQTNAGSVTGNNASNLVNFTSSLNTNTATSAAQRASAWTIFPGNTNFGRAGARGNATTGSNASGGGIYASGNNATTTNRAFGMLGTGNAPAINATAQFTNATGSTITSLLIGYTGEQFQAQIGLASFIEVRYSTVSAAAALTGTLISGFTFNAINNSALVALNGDAAGNRNVFTAQNLNGLSVANGSSVWISFLYSRGTVGGGSAQGLALDDITVSAAGTSAPATLVWTGTGGAWDNATAAWKNTVANDTTWNNTTNFATTAVFDGAGSNTVDIAAGGITANALRFDTSGYTVQGSGTLALSGGGLQVTNAGDTATVNAILAGTNGLTKNGSGELILGGANTFTGTINVSGGTLSISSDSNLGSTSNGIALATGTLKSTTSVSLASGRTLTGSGILAPVSGTTLTVNGSVNAGTLTVGDVGTVELAGSTGTKTITGLAYSSAGTMAVTGDTLNLSGNVTTTHTDGTATLSGPVNLGAGTRTFTVADGSSNIDLLVSANLSGAATILKLGTGTLALTGDNSALSGAGTTPATLRLGTAGVQSGGTVAIDNSNALGTGQLQFNYGTLQADNAVNLSNSWSIGGRAGTEAILSGSDITGTGSWTFFGNDGTAFGLNINNNTTFNGNALDVTGTVSSIAFGGSGTFNLGGDNSLITEAITIKDSLTVVANSSNALGTGTVSVQTGAKLKISSGVFLPNTIGLAGGTLEQVVAGGDPYATAFTSQISGGHGTVASVLSGTASAPTTISAKFSDTPSSAVSNDSGRVSDVLDFNGTGSDLFVLQLTYDEAAALLFGSESDVLLGYFSGGSWINAVLANTGNNASGLQLGYAGDFVLFQLDYGSDLSSYIGAYGIDLDNNTVWAVLNHNSEFAAFSPVPEPSTYALLGLGLGAVWIMRRKKKTA